MHGGRAKGFKVPQLLSDAEAHPSKGIAAGAETAPHPIRNGAPVLRIVRYAHDDVSSAAAALLSLLSDDNEPTAVRPRTFAHRRQGALQSVAPTVAQLHPPKDVLENSAYELPIAIGMDETCVANSEQLAHFLDSLGNHAVQLARLKLALELNENAISAV